MRFVLITMLAACLWAPGLRAGEPVTLQVDATEAPRRIFHSTLSIPAPPGPLRLVYPKWIPGDHGPTGPITDLSGLRITSGGQPVTWKRDLEDMYAVDCIVPAGQSGVDVELDYLSILGSSNPAASPTATAQLAVIDWHLFLVYPLGTPAAEQKLIASLKTPTGWKAGGSLAVASVDENFVQYAPTTLEMLVDHPVVIGAHFREIDLSPGKSPPHRVDIVAESERALQVKPEFIDSLARLVREMAALFGARHYRSYHFLVSLTDNLSHFGLEHHECSDNRMPERSLIDDDQFRQHAASLLTHEWFHSWNGKHRRPAGLATSDFQRPMRGDLLWVYEGLTEYYGDVLAVRCGGWTPETYREYMAAIAAKLAARPGRRWRPLQDTADAAQLLYMARSDWTGERREVDYYDEGELIWLEADALIRQKTAGAKSLDDFCRLFHGQSSTGLAGEAPSVKTYVAQDVYAALNEVCPGDWKSLFEQRLSSTGRTPPVAGLEAAGYELVYSKEPNEWARGDGKYPNLSIALGFSLDDDGKVTDVLRGTPAFEAGMAPGMKIVAVNSRRLSPDGLTDAVIASKDNPAPIELLVENSDFFSTLRLNYHGGEKWPHLKPREGAADLLAGILTSLEAKHEPSAPPPSRGASTPK